MKKIFIIFVIFIVCLQLWAQDNPKISLGISVIPKIIYEGMDVSLHCLIKEVMGVQINVEEFTINIYDNNNILFESLPHQFNINLEPYQICTCGGTILTNLSHGITYKVVAMCKVNENWFELGTIEDGHNPINIYLSRPLSPWLISPSDKTELTTNSLTLNWEDGGVPIDSFIFHAQVSNNSNFSNIVLENTTLSSLYWSINDLSDGTYYWRVRGVSYGWSDWSSSWSFTIKTTSNSVLISDNQVENFELWQNYPNPFNPSTTIRYYLSATADVNLNIYDMKGRKIVNLLEDKLDAGHHETEWNGSDFSGKPAASGVYFIRLIANGNTITRKILLME